jgi:hypothetical protein
LCIQGGGGARSCHVGTARFAFGCIGTRTLVQAVLATFVLLVKRTNNGIHHVQWGEELVADVCVDTEKNIATDS